jgi:hypothetical protein
MSVMPGQGDGTLLAPVDISAAWSPADVAAADYNGDGKRDLAWLDTPGSALRFLWGQGDFTFLSGPSLETAPQPARLWSIDLNADGTPDLAILHLGGQSLGRWYFGTPAAASLRLSAAAPSFLLPADLNGDKVADLIVGSKTSLI